MNKIIVSDFSTKTEIISLPFIRFSFSEGKLAVMFDGGMKKEASEMKQNKLYIVQVFDTNNDEIINGTFLFISYNFTYMTSINNKELVVGDNSILFQKIE